MTELVRADIVFRPNGEKYVLLTDYLELENKIKKLETSVSYWKAEHDKLFNERADKLRAETPENIGESYYG